MLGSEGEKGAFDSDLSTRHDAKKVRVVLDLFTTLSI